MHGNTDIASFVIEFESNYLEEIVMKNVSTYTVGPVAEVFTLDVTKLPDEPRDMADAIQTQTWL